MVDEKKAKEMFEENINIVYSVVHKLFPSLVNDEDVVQEAMIGLYKACLTYDESKGKLATLAYRCISNQVNMELRKRNRFGQIKMVSMQDSVKTSDDGEDLTIEGLIEDIKALDEIEERESAEDVANFISTLSDYELKFVRCNSKGLTQQESAKLLHMSQANYSRQMKKIRKKFKEWQDNVN